MKTYAYLRVSTDKQATDTQEYDLLRRFPEAELIRETASGVKARPALEALLAVLQPGDTLAVAALDRLGRRTSEILTLIEALQRRGINIVSLREGLDYSTAVGKVTAQILVVVSELERSLISQRTKAAMGALKAKGVKLGRPRGFAPEAVDKAKELKAAGATHREIRALTNISLDTLSRMFR